jgi:hypothetical protein
MVVSASVSISPRGMAPGFDAAPVVPAPSTDQKSSLRMRR